MKRKLIAILLLLSLTFGLTSLKPTHVQARLLASQYSSQPNGTDGVDTFISSLNPTTNYETNAGFSAGEDNTATAIYHALIKFDLSSIPSNATINWAVLTLWIRIDRSSNTRDFSVYRILRNWSEAQATWNIYSTGNNWQTAGGTGANDIDSTVWATTQIGSAAPVDSQVTWSLDATEFKKLVDGTYTNYGWMLKTDTELNDAYNFYTSDEATKTTQRPQLVVDYTVQTNTNTPTNTPTNTATFTPTDTATNTPTDTATFTPTDTYTPTATDTGAPTSTFTNTPTFTFTPTDTLTPTITLTPTDTLTPTATRIPGIMPTIFFDSAVTYGDYSLVIALLCTLVLISLIALIAIFMTVTDRRRN